MGVGARALVVGWRGVEEIGGSEALDGAVGDVWKN